MYDHFLQKFHDVSGCCLIEGVRVLQGSVSFKTRPVIVFDQTAYRAGQSSRVISTVLISPRKSRI